MARQVQIYLHVFNTSVTDLTGMKV